MKWVLNGEEEGEGEGIHLKWTLGVEVEAILQAALTDILFHYFYSIWVPLTSSYFYLFLFIYIQI